MKAKMVIQVIMIVAIVVGVNACGSVHKHTMKQWDAYSPPSLPASGSYTAVWAKMHRVLALSENLGVRHDLFLEDGRQFSGIKVVDKDPRTGHVKSVRLLVIITEPVDVNSAKGYISSRSGKHYYSPDGQNEFGKYSQKLDWSKISPLGKSCEIWNIVPGSDQARQVDEIIVSALKELEKMDVPGLWDELLARVGKITTEDVFLGGAGNFAGLYAVVGMRAWSIIDTLLRKRDPNSPLYDDALVTRYDLAKSLENLTAQQEEALGNWYKAMDKWSEQAAEWDKLRAAKQQ